VQLEIQTKHKGPLGQLCSALNGDRVRKRNIRYLAQDWRQLYLADGAKDICESLPMRWVEHQRLPYRFLLQLFDLVFVLSPKEAAKFAAKQFEQQVHRLLPV
jgi:hypothetical protein